LVNVFSDLAGYSSSPWPLATFLRYFGKRRWGGRAGTGGNVKEISQTVAPLRSQTRRPSNILEFLLETNHLFVPGLIRSEHFFGVVYNLLFYP
jgi:hypothetical protein